MKNSTTIKRYNLAIYWPVLSNNKTLTNKKDQIISKK